MNSNFESFSDVIVGDMVSINKVNTIGMGAITNNYYDYNCDHSDYSNCAPVDCGTYD
jgi:hypothetical protein